MGDAILDKSKDKAMSATKDYLRAELQRAYCDAGGNQAACFANVEALVDMIYETAMYILKLQKANPGKPVHVSVIIEFTAEQMKVLGKWGGNDAVACAAATTLFGFSIVRTVPAIAINGVIATTAATSGLGVPLALGAGALALGGAALLLWEGYGTYDSCAPLWNRPELPALRPAVAGGQSSNRQQAEIYLQLLQRQMSVEARSCTLSSSI